MLYAITLWSSPHGPRARFRRRRYVQRGCSFMHVPYRHKKVPFEHMKLVQCRVCRRKWVPETLLSGLEPPRNLPIQGPPVLIEARVCMRKDSCVAGVHGVQF